MIRCLLVWSVLVVASMPAAESAPYASRSLDEVLHELGSHGLPIVFSSLLVRSDMTIMREPAPGAPARVLEQLLADQGLQASPGPGGILRVVAAPSGGPVSHISVVSDRVEDVSSLAAWAHACLKPEMTDEQKGLKIWETVVKFSHQASPPHESGPIGADVHDAIKEFNVYGYGQCCCASAAIEQLARYVGLDARGRAIRGHSVPEVYWSGHWHLLDASLINYFPMPDGTIASVDDIISAIASWRSEHPDIDAKDRPWREVLGADGWKRGPPLLAACPFYDAKGWLPARTHDWGATMSEYNGGGEFVFEYGYLEGYEVNIQLRPGERLVRNWSERGLHVDLHDHGAHELAGAKVGDGDLCYSPRYGDLAPGRLGNGTLSYAVPLASGAYRGGALLVDNVASTAQDHRLPAVHVVDPSRPASIVLRMPCSYIYLGGTLACDAVIGAGGAIVISLSDNHGADWQQVARIASTGSERIDLSPLVLRRYDYRLRCEFIGAGTGLDRMDITHDIQHSQRALPALGIGINTISFSAGAQQGTIAIEGSGGTKEGGDVRWLSDAHATMTGFRTGPPYRDALWIEGRQAQLTIPVETPGDITRLRMGCHYRARGQGDGWDYQVSFDHGATFTSIGSAHGQVAGNCAYSESTAIPPGARSALVRFSGTQNNTCGIFDLRIDADYREPRGGFRPVAITYRWTEDGAAKEDVHIARSPSESYTITCAARPIMSSITLEPAH
ncbi:MAG: hypothetical protein H0W83_08420 [Planctomycetes bacterium]|nr:hypothetical protein [Planctomycetota bacterium]